MISDTHFFMVWAHRSAESIFGAAAKPVIRNGAFLCFDSERRALAECDRLNARSGGSHERYSIKLAHAWPSAPRDPAPAGNLPWLSSQELARRLARLSAPSA
jgi:hypothetical protein